MALVTDNLGKFSNGNQHKIVQSGERGYADMAAIADLYVIGQVPGGAVITNALVRVKTVFDAAVEKVDLSLVKRDGTGAIALVTAADALTVGTTLDAGLALTTLAEPYLIVVNNDVGGNTQGLVAAEVEYYVEGRSNENEG